jgi:hypothetical protein
MSGNANEVEGERWESVGSPGGSQGMKGGYYWKKLDELRDSFSKLTYRTRCGENRDARLREFEERRAQLVVQLRMVEELIELEYKRMVEEGDIQKVDGGVHRSRVSSGLEQIGKGGK